MKKRKLPKTLEELQVQIALGALEIGDVLSMLRSKKTSGDIIEMLSNVKYSNNNDEYEDWWKDIQKRRSIANHPNTPTSVLTSIFHQREFIKNPKEINGCDADILLHPSFPKEFLSKIFLKLTYDQQFDKEYSYLFEAIRNPGVPMEHLKGLAKHKNSVARAFVALHINTSPETLELLSIDDGNGQPWRPQEHVASNPHTPPRVLKAMSTNPNVSIRRRIACNENTPIDTLKAMVATDRSPKIRPTALYTLFKLGEAVFKTP